jgi:hypothetical protein
MSTANFTLIDKLNSLPEDLKKEVEDFIDFLKFKDEKPKPPKQQIVLGLAKGMITMKDDFDEPLEDFKEYM